MTQPETLQPGEKADVAADPSASSPLNFAPVSLRSTCGGWTPGRQRAFIEALADSGCVRHAAEAVGMTEQSAHRLRRRSDAASFSLAWAGAMEIAVARLTSAVMQRALEGVLDPVWYHGEVVGQRRVYDNRLAMFLIARADRQRAARDRWNDSMMDRCYAPDDVESVTYNWDRYMEALEKGEEPTEIGSTAAKEVGSSR